MKGIKKIMITVAALAASMSIMTGCIKYEDPNQAARDAQAAAQSTYESMAEGKRTGLHHVEIDVEDYGTIYVELDSDTAPVTVDNFMRLAESGFYNGLTFHRIMSGFMIQGGDPNGDGTGGSDETIVGEFESNGIPNDISHVRGVISMARNGYDMNSASSQFFIVHSDDYTDTLDGNYAAFGHVTEGMDIVDQICAVTVNTDGNGGVAPENQPVITEIRVID